MTVACKPDAFARHFPLNPDATDPVTFTVSARDAQGIAQIEVKVNGSVVKTCANTTVCLHSGGPYPARDQSWISYGGIATDSKGHKNEIGPFYVAVGRPWTSQVWAPSRALPRHRPSPTRLRAAARGRAESLAPAGRHGASLLILLDLPSIRIPGTASPREDP